MQLTDHVVALRGHGLGLARALQGADLEVRVPSCPEWALRDLVRHLGVHHRWVAGNIERAPDDGMMAFEGIEPPDDDAAYAEWIASGVRVLADRLEEVGPDRACWTWAPPLTTGFWARRTAHETVIHGWDARNALGAPPAIEALVAADGIDEGTALLEASASWRPPFEGTGTIHVHCTDVEGEWLLTLDGGPIRVTREHAKGDIAVRGPAADVELFLVNRRDDTGLEIFGDRALLDRFQEWSRF
jgi:uncharacterized protein (TIGR03083 family)